jgi:hypothetical protein
MTVKILVGIGWFLAVASLARDSVAEPPVEIGDHALIGDFANVARAEN